ncbi:mucoidy inhibitor MuiA family protein [Flavobacterium sp.]|jgi:TonB-dependent SusC/RagA subfamily outer membrane receptor|uniref:mucoidy inhibitor MuiA family protein n=1 Tax=Flavobacterium sp. TaxID=239 RepID=UPI0037C109C5
MKKILLLTLLISTISFAQKPIFTSAKVKSATVYFNAAELQQTTTVNLPVGTSEIVIKNVADYLNENTIQIGAPSSVTVLSVQFTQNYISEYEIDESNPAIKKVRDSITLVQKEIKKIQIETYSHQQTIGLLDNNQTVAGANSGLSVTELIKLVDYYKAKRTELDNAIVSLQEKESNWNKKLKALNDKLVINTQKEDKTSKGKLVLQVMNEIAGNVNLDINYITNSATWNPFYDLRVDNVKDPINIMYKAQVTQNSGIDWKKVKLTLSSGNPNQNNQAPLLQAWFLRYGNPYKKVGYSYRDGDSQSNVFNSLQGQLAGVNIRDADGAPGSDDKIRIRGYSTMSGDKNPLYIVNGVPYEGDISSINPQSIKSTTVLKDAAATSIYGSRGSNGVIVITTKQMDDYTSINENQLNVSFDIDIPYDILSNGKAHSVALKEIKLPATYKYYAAPRVDKEAFLLAEINDYSKYNLLPGEANIIFEGLYVGKTTINPNQTADTLNLSMGRDKKINIKREKVVDKSGTKFLSSYKEQTFTYDLTVRNNKKEEIFMLLKDQYPLSTDKEVTIELLEDGKAKVNTETGILTWELKLAPNETKKIRISYKVKYPKDKVIDNL